MECVGAFKAPFLLFGFFFPLVYEVGVGRQFLTTFMHPISLASKTPDTFVSEYLLKDIDRTNSLEK